MIIPYEQLDRTIYELIRRELVSIGALPDRKILSPTQYAQALSILRAEGSLIELFGQGSLEARDKKEVSRITILRKNTQLGTLGANHISEFKPTLNEQDEVVSFDKMKQPTRSKNVVYEIRSIALSTQKERLMIQAISKALGFDYVNLVDPITLEDVEGELVLLNMLGDVDVSVMDFTERLFTYAFMDIWVDEAIVERGSIPPIQRITWDFTMEEDISEQGGDLS